MIIQNGHIKTEREKELQEIAYPQAFPVIDLCCSTKYSVITQFPNGILHNYRRDQFNFENNNPLSVTTSHASQHRQTKTSQNTNYRFASTTQAIMLIIIIKIT